MMAARIYNATRKCFDQPDVLIVENPDRHKSTLAFSAKHSPTPEFCSPMVLTRDGPLLSSDHALGEAIFASLTILAETLPPFSLLLPHKSYPLGRPSLSTKKACVGLCSLILSNVALITLITRALHALPNSTTAHIRLARGCVIRVCSTIKHRRLLLLQCVCRIVILREPFARYLYSNFVSLFYYETSTTTAADLNSTGGFGFSADRQQQKHHHISGGDTQTNTKTNKQIHRHCRHQN